MPDRRRGGRVLVPGEAQARGGLEPKTLLVPRGMEDPPPVLVGRCLVCGSEFFRGEEEVWQRHVGRCARAHLPEIQAGREEKKRRLAAFESMDPEWDAHQRQVGKRMLREGRLVPRPNER